MHRVLFIALACLLMSIRVNAAQVCQVAQPEHASHCEHDDLGMCCMIASDSGCYEVTCYDFSSCAWDASIRMCP